MNTFQIAATHTKGLGSLVGIPMGYGLDGRGSVPVKGKFFSPQLLDRLWDPYASQPMGTEVSFPGGKAASA
jgi:hypothetical protein